MYYIYIHMIHELYTCIQKNFLQDPCVAVGYFIYDSSLQYNISRIILTIYTATAPLNMSLFRPLRGPPSEPEKFWPSTRFRKQMP